MTKKHADEDETRVVVTVTVAEFKILLLFVIYT